MDKYKVLWFDQVSTTEIDFSVADTNYRYIGKASINGDKIQYIEWVGTEADDDVVTPLLQDRLDEMAIYQPTVMENIEYDPRLGCVIKKDNKFIIDSNMVKETCEFYKVEYSRIISKGKRFAVILSDKDKPENDTFAEHFLFYAGVVASTFEYDKSAIIVDLESNCIVV